MGVVDGEVEEEVVALPRCCRRVSSRGPRWLPVWGSAPLFLACSLSAVAYSAGSRCRRCDYASSCGGLLLYRSLVVVCGLWTIAGAPMLWCLGLRAFVLRGWDERRIKNVSCVNVFHTKVNDIECCIN